MYGVPDSPAVDNRKLTLAIARTRLAIGVGLMATPALASWIWAGPGQTNSSVRLFARTTGIREIALGLGTEISMKAEQRPSDWLSMSALCDLADGTFGIIGRGPWTRKAISLTAFGVAAVQFSIAQQLAKELGDDPRA